MTPSLSAPDVQASVPATQVSLSRVGVTGVEKVIRVKADGTENLYHANFECFVDLEPRQAGVHMSRFEEVVGEAIDAVVLGEAFRAETLAAHIAERVRESQHGRRAEVSVSARYPETVKTPATGHSTQEIYGLFGTAVASERGNRTLTGVQAQGMTACPCAQEMVAELGPRTAHRRRLRPRPGRAGDRGRPRRHPQPARHRHPLHRLSRGWRHLDRRAGAAAHRRGLDELRDLRADEAPRRARRRRQGPRQPRFVEDCVREMIRAVVEGYPDLPAEAFVMARQENLETIHRHNVVAERYGTLGDLRQELASGEHTESHTTMREWLEAPSA